MANDNIEIETHNYEPVNKYIEDQARLKRSASTWRYAKAAALILVAIGVLAVLLAWAYYLYKKPERLVSLAEVNEKIIQNEKRFIENERKLIENERRFLENERKLVENEKRIIQNEGKLSEDDEIGMNSYKKQLEQNRNKKDKEILDKKKEIQNNPENQQLKKELDKLEKEKKELMEKLNQQNKVQLNVVHFRRYETKINNLDAAVVTRLEYDDPRNSTPNQVSCYIQFYKQNIAIIELGDKNEDFTLTEYAIKETGISKRQIENIKRKNCQYY